MAAKATGPRGEGATPKEQFIHLEWLTAFMGFSLTCLNPSLNQSRTLSAVPDAAPGAAPGALLGLWTAVFEYEATVEDASSVGVAWILRGQDYADNQMPPVVGPKRPRIKTDFSSFFTFHPALYIYF